MARMFPSPSEIRKEHPLIEAWVHQYQLHPAVALAICAVADEDDRTFEDICYAPSVDEVHAIQDAIAEYITFGDLPKEENGVYKWGKGSIRLS